MLRKKQLSKSLIITLGSFLLLSLGCEKQVAKHNIKREALMLRQIRQQWEAEHKTNSLSYLSGSTNYFEFTNEIAVGKMRYHCVLGCRSKTIPPGVLAETQERVFLFINDDRGQVTVSPENHWIKGSTGTHTLPEFGY